MKPEICKKCQNFHFNDPDKDWCVKHEKNPFFDICQNFIPPGSNATWPMIDERPGRGVWAPGEYLLKCPTCGNHFLGDKRAYHCADCEYDRG